MRRFCITIISLMILVFAASRASEATSVLYDWAFNVDGTIYEFTAGDSMPVGGTLNSEGLGTLTWSTSVSGSHNFIAFFDHEIQEATNTFFNEYGEAINTQATIQSWEIDEPGFRDPNPGDIYDHVLAGALDNINAVPQPTPDDVSWAMGWDFNLLSGENALISV